jgi:hypothetical protein
MITDSPLLITATFDPGKTPQVALSSIKDRIEKSLEGLIAWLQDPSFQQIVFVKNCTTRINPEILKNVARAYNKNLEFLEVSSSPRTVIQGKGYGEGDLIHQALRESHVLRQAKEFFKITGKLYSPDVSRLFTGKGSGEFLLAQTGTPARAAWPRHLIAPLYQQPSGSRFLGFLRRRLRLPWSLIAAHPRGWIDTRFYRVRRDFYLTSLSASHRRVQDALGYTLETAFYDDLKNYEGIHYIHQEPIIVGTSGTFATTAGIYSPQIQEEARDLAARLMG